MCPFAQYSEFRQALRSLVKKQSRRNRQEPYRPADPAHGTVTGIFRRTAQRLRFRPAACRRRPAPARRSSSARRTRLDASTGDEVLVRITRKPSRPELGPVGEIVQVLERATRQFVGTYFERDGQGFVRVDGTVFSHSIYVGDPGAKGAKPDDKVVIEMLRFPTPEDRGEGVITEVLGPRGQPGVDTLSIIRAFEPARQVSRGGPGGGPRGGSRLRRGRSGRPRRLHGADHRHHRPGRRPRFRRCRFADHDSRSKHWQLGVHIADVAHFAPPGSALDREARKRGTSVYLPQRVLPMFPEIISNSLASLQQGRVRYVKSVLIDFTPAGQRTEARFAECRHPRHAAVHL